MAGSWRRGAGRRCAPTDTVDLRRLVLEDRLEGLGIGIVEEEERRPYRTEEAGLELDEDAEIAEEDTGGVGAWISRA